MGSPCSHDQWLELSLGLKGTKKKLQEKEEEETKLHCQNTSHEHLDEEINEDCLELRLQIGPNKNYNMGLMDLMYHQNKKKQKGAFHSDCYYNYYSSLTNFRLSSSSPSPNSAGFWFSLLSSPNRSPS
ncbi:unnamed protein product [Citrullus colocynthis]|uniref:Uncharacterized protein n=1 Tax=Citrullus colocynthis TaxID=252529 RepID=A0ABP0Y7D4_9ROSI